MVKGGMLVVFHHRTHHLADVAHFTASTHNDGSRRDNLLTVGILLSQRQRVLTGGYVDMQLTAEVRQGLDTGIQTGILTLLTTAGPHPVG